MPYFRGISLLLLLLNLFPTSLAMVVQPSSISKGSNAMTQVAVVGSGVAALSCARELARLSKNGENGDVAVTLFTSRSKMATQMGPKNQSAPKNGKPFFDYGVQYATASGPEFATELRRWERDLGLCTRLDDGEIGTISHEAGYVPFVGDGAGRGGCYVGNGGMGVLMTKLVDQAEKEFSDSTLTVVRGFPDQNKKVNTLSKTSPDGGWTLKAKDGTVFGPFGIVVGAFAQHCLTDPFLLSGGAPAKDMLSCLRRVESNQLIVMQVSFSPPLSSGAPPFTAAHVRGEECLSFVSNNSRRPHQDGRFKEESAECWTLISTASFGEREYNTNQKGYRRTAEKKMLDAFRRVLKVRNLESHHPKINRINHWEDGLSTNRPPSSPGCLFDDVNGLGWCGDFCADSPNLEGAAQSGREMARRIDAIAAAAVGGDRRKAAARERFLPSAVDWVPRATDDAVTSSSALVDIGQFRHGSKELPHRFTHCTNVVPSYVDGYYKAGQRPGGTAGGKSGGNSRREGGGNNGNSSSQRNGRNRRNNNSRNNVKRAPQREQN